VISVFVEGVISKLTIKIAPLPDSFEERGTRPIPKNAN
jgi:hypothetical protein